MPPIIPDEREDDIAHEGPCGTVRFARCAEGCYPAKEFYDSLPPKKQAKFATLFKSITSVPTLRLNNRTQFKQIEGEGELFEFKRSDIQSRIFCFREGNTWYLVHGFGGKKEDDLPNHELLAGRRRLAEAKACLGKRR